MQVEMYEKAILVAACWRLAANNDVNELLAIACCIRNWVIPRFGAPVREMMSGKAYFSSYSEAVESFLSVYPTRPLPAINEGALIDPQEGLLVKIDSVYDCTLADITSSRSFPYGARYFGRSSNPNIWFHNEILARQDVHPLIGTFGSQQFYV